MSGDTLQYLLAGRIKQLGWMKKEFASILGISAPSLCDIEKGRRIPSARRAANIANKIGQPESYWIRLAFQDMLRLENLDYTVSVA